MCVFYQELFLFSFCIARNSDLEISCGLETLTQRLIHLEANANWNFCKGRDNVSK